jgi:aspartate-semialdehyde dehydrogenase
MKKINLAILGATGIIGREMLKILEERKFPVKKIKLFAHKSEAGEIIGFNGKELVVEEVKDDSFTDLDITLVAVSNEVSKKLMPLITESGSIAIDNSSAFRLVDDIPLVVPEINPDAVLKHKGIIANPNCSTIIGLVAINEINKYAEIERMIVSTYQAVSGLGVNGINELEEQTRAVLNSEEYLPEIFDHVISFNVIPNIGIPQDNGFTNEEMKMLNEGRKILDNPNLRVNCTCVRVPVIRSHSESITIETKKEISVEKARELLSNAKGVKLVDNLANKKYPMPLDTSGQDLVYVGRIRKDISRDGEKSLSLWCCGDQIRKGAATNAIQIAELLIEKNLV